MGNIPSCRPQTYNMWSIQKSIIFLYKVEGEEVNLYLYTENNICAGLESKLDQQDRRMPDPPAQAAKRAAKSVGLTLKDNSLLNYYDDIFGNRAYFVDLSSHLILDNKELKALKALKVLSRSDLLLRAEYQLRSNNVQNVRIDATTTINSRDAGLIINCNRNNCFAKSRVV